MKNIAAGGVLERIRRMTPPHVTAPFRTVAEWREWQLAEGQKRCEEINRLNRQLRVEKILNRSGIQPLHSKCSFANYQVQNDGQKYALSQAKSIADELMTGCTNFVFSGKTGTGKNHLAAAMGNRLMAKLESAGIPTHYVQELNQRETLVKKVSIVPLEVIIRNISAGSFAKRYGVEEGIVFDAPTIEFSYKNDELGDPLLNEYHALALKLATKEEIDLIKKYAFAVNDLLKDFMKEIGIDLVDFKLEFGKTADGTIVLADEISPDTCRLWDEKTHEKLDKDRFRRDLGGAEEAYEEVMRRLMGDK